MSVLEAALRYHDLGWPVLPLQQGTGRQSKRPHSRALAITRGSFEWGSYRDEPASPSEIRTWFTRYPWAGLAVITGHRLVVADVEADAQTPAYLLEATQNTPTAHSPKGGRHFYFEGTGRQRTLRRPSVGFGDLLATGSYVAVPPSPGREWLVSPFDVPLAPLPPELAELSLTSDTQSTCGLGVIEGSATEATEDFLIAALRVLGIRYQSLKKVYCPHHDDAHASAGFLQGDDGAWILNCFGCGYKGTLGSVYAAVRGAPRSGPTIARWWHRLRWETGVLELPSLDLQIPEVTGTVRKICEGFALLMRIQAAVGRPGDDPQQPFTRAFGMPWCGVSESSFVRGKGRLIASGWLRKVDSIQAGGREMTRYLAHGMEAIG